MTSRARTPYAVMLSSLVAMLCLIGLVMLAPHSTRAAASRIYQVLDLEWGQQNREFWVAIVGETPPTYTVYELPDPQRVVVEIANSTLTFPLDIDIEVDGPFAPVASAKGIELKDKDPRVTRVEFMLTSPASYSVKREENDIVLVFKEGLAPMAAAPPKPETVAAPPVAAPIVAPMPPPAMPATKPPVKAEPTVPSGRATVIFDVKVDPAADETRVFIRADGPIKNFQKAELSANKSLPPRMYIDIPNIRMPRLLNKKNVNKTLAGIRFGRRNSGVRVVFDSAKSTLFPYSILTSPDGLLVTIGGSGGREPAVEQAMATEEVQPVPEAAPVAAPRAAVAAAPPVPTPAPTLTPKPAPQVSTPPAAKEPAAVRELIMPVIPATVKQPPKAAAKAKPEPKTEKPAAKAAAKKEAKKPEISDEFGFAGFETQRIAMDFFKTDLHNVFRLFGEISGRNIVVDEAVKGSLTLALNDVPWDFALDIILNLKDLQKEEQFNTIVISPKDKKFVWPERGTKNIEFKAGETMEPLDSIRVTERTELPKGEVEAQKLLHQARLKENQGAYLDALKLYEDAFAKWPENAQVAKRISSLCLVNLGRNALAVQYAEAAMKIDPHDKDAALLAAIGMANMKKTMQAKAYFDLAINAPMPSSEALRNYAAFCEENRSYNAALQLLDKHQDLYGYTLDTMVSKARLHDKKGDKQRAVQEYRAIINSGFDMPADLKRYISGRIAMKSSN